MPTKPLPVINAWSFSRLGDYRMCPFKAKLKCVDKLKEPESEAMAEGTRIHKLAEDYVLGNITRLPKELQLFKAEFAALKKQKGVECEAEWTFTANFDRVTGWFSKDAWCRIKVDAHYLDAKTNRVRVIDYKTGKIKDTDLEQLELYALAALLLYPDCEGVDCELWYTKLGELLPPNGANFENTTAVKKRLLAKWVKASKPMLADRKFKPTPNALCRWCHFRNDNGGPCAY